MFMLYNVDLHLCAAAANRIMLVGFAKGKMIPKQHKTLTRIVVDTKVIRCLTSTRSKWNTYGGAHMPIYSGLIHVASAWIVASHVLRGGCFQRGIPSSVAGLAATWQSQRTSKHVVRLLDRCKAQCSSMFCYLFSVIICIAAAFRVCTFMLPMCVRICMRKTTPIITEKDTGHRILTMRLPIRNDRQPGAGPHARHSYTLSDTSSTSVRIYIVWSRHRMLCWWPIRSMIDCKTWQNRPNHHLRILRRTDTMRSIVVPFAGTRNVQS